MHTHAHGDDVFDDLHHGHNDNDHGHEEDEHQGHTHSSLTGALSGVLVIWVALILAVVGCFLLSAVLRSVSVILRRFAWRLGICRTCRTELQVLAKRV